MRGLQERERRLRAEEAEALLDGRTIDSKKKIKNGRGGMCFDSFVSNLLLSASSANTVCGSLRGFETHVAICGAD